MIICIFDRIFFNKMTKSGKMGSFS